MKKRSMKRALSAVLTLCMALPGASEQTFLYGMLPSVSSVTSVLMYVLMQQSVQSL